MEEGIVPGGGVALLYASKILGGIKGGLNFDQKIGVDIVERALSVPLKTIANNAGARPTPPAWHAVHQNDERGLLVTLVTFHLLAGV